MSAASLVVLGTGALFGVVAALEPAAGRLPHIVMHLADDFGWANAGYCAASAPLQEHV